jgi:conjugative transfer signal peptidase TraF
VSRVHIQIGIVATACLLAGKNASPRLLFNASGSAPLGFYVLDPKSVPRQGDLVAVTPPPALAAFLNVRAYLPQNTVLLKQVYGADNDVLCRQADAVSLNGQLMARALSLDRQSRPLPVWQGCVRMGADSMALFLPHPRSFDSRYFGLLPRQALRGVARPLWTWPERGGDDRT